LTDQPRVVPSEQGTPHPMLKHGAFFEIFILMYPYIPVLPAPLREARPGEKGALGSAG
jgi:hypothetical protein